MVSQTRAVVAGRTHCGHEFIGAFVDAAVMSAMGRAFHL
jgi:hypothetical protein